MVFPSASRAAEFRAETGCRIGDRLIPVLWAMYIQRVHRPSEIKNTQTINTKLLKKFLLKTINCISHDNLLELSLIRIQEIMEKSKFFEKYLKVVSGAYC